MNLMTGKDLRYLLGFLNSRVCDYQIRRIAYSREGGYFEYKKKFVEQLHVPTIPNASKNQLVQLVDQKLNHKSNDQSTVTEDIESKIDGLMYELFEFYS